MQVGILEPDGFPDDARRILAALGPVRDRAGEPVDRFVTDVEVLVVRLAHRIGPELLAAAPRLRAVGSATTGHTHLDEAALAARGVELVTLRGETEFLRTIRATPEHTLGLIIALLRRYPAAFLHPGNRHWDRDRCRGREIGGLRVGIVGMGRVGTMITDMLVALGAEVAFVDVRPEASHDRASRLPSVERLVAWSEMVVLCASHAAGQPPILDRGRLAGLRGRYLVNTARGELVDEEALLELVRSDAMAGMATDVLDQELTHPRLDAWLEAARGRNVVITPHIGGATHDAMARCERFIAEALVRRLREARR